MDKMDRYKDAPLTETIIGCGMKVHNRLGPGFLESVYHRAMAIELGRLGHSVASDVRIAVYYDTEQVGDFVADIVVDQRVLVEIKAVRTLILAHEVQLVNYLTATRVETGLLLNFGSPRLQFRRKARLLAPN